MPCFRNVLEFLIKGGKFLHKMYNIWQERNIYGDRFMFIMRFFDKSSGLLLGAG